MIRLLALSMALLFPLASQAAGKAGGARSLGAAPQSPSHSGGGGGGGGRRYQDPRRAPPMDPNRRIHEQDCTKPIDASAGNLRCRKEEKA